MAMDFISEKLTLKERLEGREEATHWISKQRLFPEEKTANAKTWRKEDAHLVVWTARKPWRLE